jgi:hypothetical protein
MDLFKQSQYKYVGIGGIHCRCCSYNARVKGNCDKTLNRMARTNLKNKTKQVILNGIMEYKDMEDFKTGIQQMELAEYLNHIKSQLVGNVTQAEQAEYGSYNYTDEQIDSNSFYFEHCRDTGLSAYKALLFFHDYLNGDYTL